MKPKNAGNDAAPKTPVKIPNMGLKPFPPFLPKKEPEPKSPIPKKVVVRSVKELPAKTVRVSASGPNPQARPKNVPDIAKEPPPSKTKLTPKDRAKLRRFVTAGKLEHRWGDPWVVTPQLLELLDADVPPVTKLPVKPKNS